MFIGEKKSLNVKKLVFGLLVVFLIAGTVWFFRAEMMTIINRVPNEQVIVFPAVENRAVMKKDFDSNSVALEISRFIPEEAKEKTLWRLRYADVDSAQTIGFELVYKLNSGNNNLTKFYEEQLNTVKTNGWKLLAANLEDSQAFLDIERKNPSAGYKVRISAEQKDNSIEIKVQYLITRY